MSDTNNVKLGVCEVLYDGVDLGFTKGGVEVEVATSTHEVMVDQTGETPIGELITGRTVSARVPLAETTLENLVKIMPGATLSGDGVAATGTITLTTAAPSANDKVTIAGQAYTFKVSPVNAYDVLIGSDHLDSAASLALIIDGGGDVQATETGGVITITANDKGVAGNLITLTKTGTNIAVSGSVLASGADATARKVEVVTGVSINLLTTAKELVMRPKGTTGADDFVIHRAACPGAISFAYKIDEERIFNAEFKGYADGENPLFTIGNALTA